MAKNEQYQNSEYWEDRIANETWKTYNDLEEKNIDLLKMYEKSSRNIKNELLALAEKAEQEGSLGRTDQYRFNKLLGQQGEIFKECERLGEQIEKHSINGMKQGGKDVYKNIMQSLGNNDFAYPNKKTMEQMLRSRWHGSFFSERLWRDMGKLERNLNGVINDGISTGKTITEMAVQLSNVMQQSFNVTHRLVRTETINYLNRSAKLGYEKAGIKEVQWWAAEDERTCEICGANHGKEYDIDKTPILPCHPGCRCTWLPVVDKSVSKIDEKVSEVINKARKIEPSITRDLKSIVKNIGTKLEGLDFRKKTQQSLTRKVISEMNSGKSLEDALNRMYDNVRYTNVSTVDKMTDDYHKIIEALEDKGYNIVRVKNTFNQPVSYKGINAVLENPNGYKFEFQFHTESSLKIKELNHKLYEEQRLDSTSLKRKEELAEKMKENSSKIEIPKNIETIKNFNKL